MSNSEKYPELFEDLAAHAAEILVQDGMGAEKAAEMGLRIAERIRGHWSGQQIYLPKGQAFVLEQRDLEIWRRFTGRNTAQLAREFQLTEVRIYQIVKRMRAEETRRRQGDMFSQAKKKENA